jgi:phospho-N-acetylmuramoyl-pentapeptide-transferase
MLYNLFAPLGEHLIVFNLFRYLTFRSGAACITALAFSLALGPCFIRWLKSVQHNGQPIRADGPARHLVEKKGTPTMGGVLILAGLTASTLLWANLRNGYVWVALLLTLGYGAIGFIDDYIKLSRANSRGLSARAKLLLQAGLASWRAAPSCC